MELRSKRPMAGETQERTAKSCADCETTKTAMWRIGPNGSKTLCNACGITLRKLLAKRNSENTAKKVKRNKPKKQRTRPTASSVSTKGSTTNPSGANSTTTTASSPPIPAAAAAHGYAGGVRTRYSIRSVRFVSNKQRVVKKLRCFQRRRTNFKRTSFFFFESKWTMREVEQAAVAALLALSGSAQL